MALGYDIYIIASSTNNMMNIYCLCRIPIDFMMICNAVKQFHAWKHIIDRQTRQNVKTLVVVIGDKQIKSIKNYNKVTQVINPCNKLFHRNLRKAMELEGAEINPIKGSGKIKITAIKPVMPKLFYEATANLAPKLCPRRLHKNGSPRIYSPTDL